jgi:hypothetical protein
VSNWFGLGGGGVGQPLAATVLKAAVGVFIVGCAVRFLFARGDVQMEQVGALLMFGGGVGTLVAAIVDRRERSRGSGPRPGPRSRR